MNRPDSHDRNNPPEDLRTPPAASSAPTPPKRDALYDMARYMAETRGISFDEALRLLEAVDGG